MTDNKKIMPKKKKKILRIFPSRFKYVVTTINVLQDSSKLTLLELMKTLVACEERMQKLDYPLKQAFQLNKYLQ